MANIRSFKELRVWQKAMDTAMLVFEQSKRFPPEEKYSLTDQFRRSSRSVASNIAEAWRKRRYQAAFVSKLSDAEGEAAESQTWAEVACRCKYLSREEANEIDNCCEQILGQLVLMIDKPEDWVVGARRREDAAKGGRCDAVNGRREDAVNEGHGDPASGTSPSPRVPSSVSLPVF